MRAWLLGALFLYATVMMAQDDNGPVINKRFPVDHHLSPPSIGVVEACAQHVYVSGFVPHATIRVFVNGALVATAKPHVGFAAIAVPPLHVNDQLTDPNRSEHPEQGDEPAHDRRSSADVARATGRRLCHLRLRSRRARVRSRLRCQRRCS
jgi:hypothetical protein